MQPEPLVKSCVFTRLWFGKLIHPLRCRKPSLHGRDESVIWPKPVRSQKQLSNQIWGTSLSCRSQGTHCCGRRLLCNPRGAWTLPGSLALKQSNLAPLRLADWRSCSRANRTTSGLKLGLTRNFAPANIAFFAKGRVVTVPAPKMTLSLSICLVERRKSSACSESMVISMKRIPLSMSIFTQTWTSTFGRRKIAITGAVLSSIRKFLRFMT